MTQDGFVRDGLLPDNLTRGGGVSVWRQVADAIEAEIASGGLASGSQVPTEAALSARFGVNRHTVRRALASLSDRGLVRATRGLGTFVEAPPLLYPIGPRTRFSEIVAGSGRDPGGRVLSAATEAAGEEEAGALGIAPAAPVLALETLRSADGVPISLARSVFPLPRFAGIEAALVAGATLSDVLARHGAATYRRRETRITARPATPEEARLLELAPGRIVMVSDSVNVDRRRIPIQATRARFAADRVEFLIAS